MFVYKHSPMTFDYYRILGPLARMLPPESAHTLAVWALRSGLLPTSRRPIHTPSHTSTTAVLESTVWGLHFPNPIGVAAGFDKNGEVILPLFKQGFGFVEAGTVTPRPQRGNPKPRVFRLPEDQAVINRLGFNNQGMEQARANVVDTLSYLMGGAHASQRPRGIIGINIGKNKDTETDRAVEDYAQAATTLAPMADYLVINVSSPNTPGLRSLQEATALRSIIDATLLALGQVLQERHPPLLVKLAPDLSDNDVIAISDVVLAGGVAGLVISNTTIARPDTLRGKHRAETGGLSGKPLFAPSTAMLHRMYALTHGRLPIIGVGGICTGADAYAKIRAGASLVQLYTALIYHGPMLVQRIMHELVTCLERDGFASLQAAIGADHRS